MKCSTITRITVAENGREGQLEVQTIMRDSFADSFRQTLQWNSPKELSENYSRYYSHILGAKIVPQKNFETSDDFDQNVMMLTEFYSIDKIGDVDELKKTITYSIVPVGLWNNIPTTSLVMRKSPCELPYPMLVDERVELRFEGVDFDLESTGFSKANEFVACHKTIHKFDPSEWHYLFSYETLRDCIEVDRIESYSQIRDAFYKATNIDLFVTKKEQKNSPPEKMTMMRYLLNRFFN